jgi:hypothetical protein
VLWPLPNSGREETPEKEAVDHVSGGANNTFSPTILRGSIGVGESQLNVVGEKGARGRVVKLVDVVALEAMHRSMELSGDPGEEVHEGVKGVGLEPQRKSLGK